MFLHKGTHATLPAHHLCPHLSWMRLPPCTWSSSAEGLCVTCMASTMLCMFWPSPRHPPQTHLAPSSCRLPFGLASLVHHACPSIYPCPSVLLSCRSILLLIHQSYSI